MEKEELELVHVTVDLLMQRELVVTYITSPIPVVLEEKVDELFYSVELAASVYQSQGEKDDDRTPPPETTPETEESTPLSPPPEPLSLSGRMFPSGESSAPHDGHQGWKSTKDGYHVFVDLLGVGPEDGAYRLSICRSIVDHEQAALFLCQFTLVDMDGQTRHLWSRLLLEPTQQSSFSPTEDNHAAIKNVTQESDRMPSERIEEEFLTIEQRGNSLLMSTSNYRPFRSKVAESIILIPLPHLPDLCQLIIEELDRIFNSV